MSTLEYKGCGAKRKTKHHLTKERHHLNVEHLFKVFFWQICFGLVFCVCVNCDTKVTMGIMEPKRKKIICKELQRSMNFNSKSKPHTKHTKNKRKSRPPTTFILYQYNLFQCLFVFFAVCLFVGAEETNKIQFQCTSHNNKQS